MSDEVFVRRIRAAARAAWWTFLVAIGLHLVAWLGGLWALSARPDWMMALWGEGNLTWDRVHETLLSYWSTWKIVVWTIALVAIWLTLWARRLERAEPTG